MAKARVVASPMAWAETWLSRNLGKHWNGNVVRSPSTQDWAIRNPYNLDGVTAHETLEQAMAKSCLEAQIKFAQFSETCWTIEDGTFAAWVSLNILHLIQRCSTIYFPNT